MNFDPILLRAFVAVTETGGFTRAAQRLHVTQSAVSHQIQRLEELVGRPLLLRTTRSLTLTDDGTDFLRYAQQILGALDALSQRFRPSPISGNVRFGVPENFMGDQLPALLCQFTRVFPAIRLDVHVSMSLDLRAMVEADELDLAVMMSLPGSVKGDLLRKAQFVWVAAEQFAVPAGASLPFAFFPAPCINRRVGLTSLDGTSVQWHVAFTSPSSQGIRAAVLSQLAITVLTRDDLEPGMKVIDGEYGLPSLPEAGFTLIRGRGGKSPAARELGRLILAMSGAHAEPLTAVAVPETRQP